MSTPSDDRAIATIISAAREATRRERRTNLMTATRRSFRPDRRLPGRTRNSSWYKPMFLLRRSNPDFYPSSMECSFLEQNGLGKKNGIIERHWSVNRLNSYICRMYSSFPLEDVGFRFGKCGRNKKIEILVPVNTISELELQVGRNVLLITPNSDLNIIESTETNSPSTSGSNTNTMQVPSNMRTVASRNNYRFSDESDIDFLPTRRHQDIATSSSAHPDRNAPFTSGTYSNSDNTGPGNVINGISQNEYEFSDDADLEAVPVRGQNTTTSSSVRPISRNASPTWVFDDAPHLDGAPHHNHDDAIMSINFPNLLEGDTVEIVDVEVSRDTVLPQLLELYKDESIVHKRLRVTFKDELGLDHGGLTKELFSIFWKECGQEYFRGENSMAPFLPLAKIRKGQGEHFLEIGRILAHTLLLTKSLPTQFARSFYLMIGNPDRKVPGNVLLEDFFFFVTSSERQLLKKAQSSFSSIASDEMELLIDFFQTYGLLENPKGNEVSEQLTIIAENVLCKESSEMIRKMRDGFPILLEPFFEELTLSKLNILFRQQAPTTTKVIKCIGTSPEELNNIQSRAVYFFKTYVKNLAPPTLAKLLLFITASPHMPEKITLQLKNFGFPTSHTCSNVLELPVTYNTHQELSREFDAILNSDASFQYAIGYTIIF